jgi:ubiquinone/menaquinone biosynthesis C-methylase UbiE
MNQEQATAQAEKIFNAAADYFDDPVMSFWNRFGQRTIEHLQLQHGDKVLDVCCGTGASAIPAAIQVGAINLSNRVWPILSFGLVTLPS